ncbi:hypothetical protein VTJ83DRAFT_4948 [Remersonia thermophila]|uniref:Replication protein A C-terminal domain-containing protein n=1 Tax=Remersonia thermophila TaxID=72144 RepID=A0ABR4DBE8_9PEZI
MSSYGGYQRTGYGAQGGEDGGGFMSGSQQPQNSQSNEKGSFRDESLRPVTIKQIIDCKEAYPGADLAIDGHLSKQVTIVGQVRSVTAQSIAVIYRIDDGTGIIEARKYFTNGQSAEDVPTYAPNTYVRIFGRLQTYNNKRHLGVVAMRAIDDFNEVSYHLLEATYVHLFLVKGGSLTGAGAGAQHDGNAAMDAGGGDGMFVDNGYGAAGDPQAAANARLGSVSRNARAVYKYLATLHGESAHLSVVKRNTGLSENDILAGAGELLENGMIYTTEDDETWAVLDM